MYFCSTFVLALKIIFRKLLLKKTNKLALVLKTYSFVKEGQIKTSFHQRKDAENKYIPLRVPMSST